MSGESDHDFISYSEGYGKISIFLPKSQVDPFEKIQYGHCLKSIFYSLGRFVF